MKNPKLYPFDLCLYMSHVYGTIQLLKIFLLPFSVIDTDTVACKNAKKYLRHNKLSIGRSSRKPRQLAAVKTN